MKFIPSWSRDWHDKLSFVIQSYLGTGLLSNTRHEPRVPLYFQIEPPVDAWVFCFYNNRMKRTLLIVIFLGAGVLFLWYLQGQLPQLLVSNSKEGVNTTMATTTATTTAVVAPVVKLKPKPMVPALSLSEEAVKIARVPLHPDSSASSAMVASANAKISDLVAMIDNNYDFEGQWLDLGSYRKLVGDYSGAIAAWNFLAKIRPQSFIAQHNLGDLYAFSLRDYAKGEMYFLKSIELNKASAQGYLALANLYGVASFGKTDQIALILLRGIEADPNNITLITTLASYYRDVGNVDKSIEYFKMALQLAPQNNAISDALAKLEYKRDGAP